MPHWSVEEIEKAAGQIAAIDERRGNRRRNLAASAIDLSLRAALPLLQGLGGGTRAVLVRQLLRALGFDEHKYEKWRLEHKLVQALVLNHYLPGLVPVTRGLMGALAAGDPFPDDDLVKAALGDSSGEARVSLNLDDVIEEFRNADPAAPDKLVDERYIIQENLSIVQEYRVHSLEDLVIDDLTFRRYTGGSIPGERDPPNGFVQRMLDNLPDAIVGGSLLAWDVALTPNGRYMIIEVNFSGFHPVFKRGFHCSGYYHDYNWGACDTARLLNHVARVDDVKVMVHADAPEFPEENRFYGEVAAWQLRHEAQTEMNAHGSVR